MITAVNVLLPLVLLAITTPWCLRMLRSTATAPAVNRVEQVASMTAVVAVGAVALRFGIVPAWTWYPAAVAVGVGATALCVRWPTLVVAGPPRNRPGTVVSLVIDAALLILVMYASFR